jgi:hypothetical protein
MTTRRSAVKFLAGSAVGTLFTPAPWRLIMDSARWSENWPGIPRPVRGEIRTKLTRCGLCPAGCEVRARCVGEQPISLAGAHGGLCPYGVAAHHLPYHPKRVKTGPVEEARAAFDHADGIALLDLRPGRTASWLHRMAMGERKGLYLAPPEPAVSVNLAIARTVVSLGAPLLDGWVAPAAVFAIRDRFRLIQVEDVESRTAALADEWVQTMPDLARLEGPVLVIDPGMSAEVIALNRQLGGWGKTIVTRPEAPVPAAWRKAAAAVTDLHIVPDGSIETLLIDESMPGAYIPWPDIDRKLVPHATVIAFSWSGEGYGRCARFILPSPVYPEALDDLPPAFDTVEPALRILEPLVKAPEGMVVPAEFVSGRSLAEAIKERAACQASVPAVARAEGTYAGQEARPASPLFTKLYQESGLLLGPGQVAIHPKMGISGRAFLETSRGKLPVEVILDRGIPPGKVQYPPAPEFLDLCGSEEPKVVRA